MFIESNFVETLKSIAPFIIDAMPGGAALITTDHEKVTWIRASTAFDTHDLRAGSLDKGASIKEIKAVYQCMQSGELVVEKIPRSQYGMCLHINAIPIIDCEQAVGAFVLAVPTVNHIDRAFRHFAPIIVNTYPEGSQLYVGDLERIKRSQASEKFSIPDLEAGNYLMEGSPAKLAIRRGIPITHQYDASVYGTPVLVMNYPIFDEDDNSSVVGVFGIATQKANAINLHEMARNLSSSLQEISPMLQELDASATEIKTNEIYLNEQIVKVNREVEQIAEMLSFIKQIAHEAKVLGLNAAIEAARVGEVGKGFGMVAEEMRRQSDESKEIIRKINELLERIKSQMMASMYSSNSTLQTRHEQVAATRKITSDFKKISNIASNIETLSLKL